MKPVALRLPKGNLKNKMIGSMGLVFDNEQKEEQMLMQISIKKFPKDFGDTVTFEIKTNLPDGEKIEVYIYDSDSNFSNGPNAENDTNLYKANYTLGKIRIVSIAFTKAMQELAFKDVEGDSAECYIKIKNAKITDAFSEVFNVDKGANTTNLEKLATNPLSNYTPDWMKLKKDAEKTPKRIFTDEEINALTATVIGESGSGRLKLEQQMAIAWVYYNRLSSNLSKTLDESLGKGFSYAYKNAKTKKPAPDVMVVMVAFGDKTYANENSGVGSLTIQQLVNLKNESTTWYQTYIEKGKLLKIEMIKQFATPWKNLFPGYTNQGYWGDLCASVILRSDITPQKNRKGKLEDKILPEHVMWVLPVLYFYFQKEKKVPTDYDNTFVKELRTEGEENILKATTFIFKLPEIMQFFRENPSLMPETYKEIPFYDYFTGKMIFLKN